MWRSARRPRLSVARMTKLSEDTPHVTTEPEVDIPFASENPAASYTRTVIDAVSTRAPALSIMRKASTPLPDPIRLLLQAARAATIAESRGISSRDTPAPIRVGINFERSMPKVASTVS
jgi:hypothetical protein